MHSLRVEIAIRQPDEKPTFAEAKTLGFAPPYTSQHQPLIAQFFFVRKREGKVGAYFARRE